MRRERSRARPNRDGRSSRWNRSTEEMCANRSHALSCGIEENSDMLCKNVRLVDEIVHARQESTDDDLREEIPDAEPFDECIEKYRVDDDIEARERRMHRELDMHPLGP